MRTRVACVCWPQSLGRRVSPWAPATFLHSEVHERQIVVRAELDLGEAVARGVAVDVRNRFDGQWTCGFEVADVIGDPKAAGRPCYRLRRVSDGALLPVWFSADEVSQPRGVSPLIARSA